MVGVKAHAMTDKENKSRTKNISIAYLKASSRLALWVYKAIKMSTISHVCQHNRFKD